MPDETSAAPAAPSTPASSPAPSSPASDPVASAPDVQSAIDASFAKAAEQLPPNTMPGDEPPPEAPPVQPPPVPPQEEEEPEDYALADKIEPDHVDVGADGRKRLHFREDKAADLMRARDFRRAVQTAIPNATPEQIRQHYESSLIMQQMETDYNGGDPQRLNTWASHWFGRDANPNAVAAATNILARELDKVHPQAYQRMRDTVVLRLVDELYANAVQRNDDQLFAAAQHLHNQILPGKFFTKDQFQQTPDGGLAAREQAVWQREQAFQQQQNQAYQQSRQQWMQATDNAVGTMIDQEVAAALKPALEKYEFKPEQVQYMQWQLYGALEQAKKASPAFLREYQLAWQQAQSYPSAQTRSNLINLMQQFVKPIIAQNRKSVISAMTGQVMSASANAHKQLQTSAAASESNGTASPAIRSTRRDQIRGAKTTEDALNAWLA